MPALWIAHVKVSDDEAYKKYISLAGPAITKKGGKFLVRGGNFVQLEGTAKPRNVVIEFDSVESAVACYHSDDYQQALHYALNSSERELVILEIPERP